MTSPAGQNKSTEVLEDEQLTPEIQELSATDESLISTWIQLGLSGGMYYAKGRIEIHDAFNALNQKDLAQKLLNFKDPLEHHSIREAHKLTDKLIKEKGRYHMSPEDVKRRTNSLIISRRLQRRVNKLETNIRTQNTISRLGLKPENVKALEIGINNWLKEYPQGSIDEGLIAEGRKLYLSQNSTDEKKLTEDQKKQLSQAGIDIKEINKGAREQAIETQKEMTTRAELVINGNLNPNNVPSTTQQLNQQWQYIETGRLETITTTAIPSVVVSETTQTPIPGPYTTTATALPPEFQSRTVPSSSLRPSLEIPPSTKAQTPNIPAPQISVPAGRFAGLQKFFANFKNSGFGKMLGGLGRGLGILGGGVGGLLTKGITALASKLGIRAGLGAASGGIYTAASLIAGLFGIDLDKMVKKAAMFAVGVVVGLAIIVIIILNPNSSTQFPIGAENATPVAMYSKNRVKPLSWSKFEENYLTNKPNVFGDINSGWQAFEKENLLPQTPYLTLYTNGHDDVKK